MQAARLWQAALGQLQVEMPRAKFETWVRDAELLSYEDGEFIIGVKNAFARDWLNDRLRPTVKQVLGGMAGRTVDVRFVISPSGEQPVGQQPVGDQARAAISPAMSVLRCRT